MLVVVHQIRLTGQLVCGSQNEAAVVAKYLPTHIALTRAEPGCLSFVVNRTRDPLGWEVEERFTDEAAFNAHQRRAKASEWGQATSGITRRYSVDRLSR